MLVAILRRFHLQAVFEEIEVPRAGSKSLLHKVQVDDLLFVYIGVHLEGHRVQLSRHVEAVKVLALGV